MLKSYCNEGSPNWAIEAICEAFDVNPATVATVRKAYGEGGMEKVLQRKKPDREYSRMGFVSAENSIFLAMMDGDLNKMDEFIVWTLKKFFDLTGDDDTNNYGLSSIPGRSTEQYHIDFKQKLIKRITLNYHELDPSKQMTIRKLWTFEDFYHSHKTSALEHLPPSLPLIY